MQTIASYWKQEEKTLVTHLQGKIYLEDISLWRESLEVELAKLEENTCFKISVDLYGYEPGALAAHKAMRTVIPLLLARYNFRTALLDLFAPLTLPLQKVRGNTCIAAAHTHHDVEKMSELDRTISRVNERFFSGYTQAKDWLQQIL